MTQSAALSLLVVVAVLFANIPLWVSGRLHGALSKSATPRWSKTTVAVFTLLLAYGVFIGVAWFIESQLGQRSPQGWAFYAVTGCMFLTFAFPSFVYHFLMRR